MFSFSELEFKWFVHVIDVYTKYMLSTLDFLTISHLKSMIFSYIMALRIANSRHVIPNMAICILK